MLRNKNSTRNVRQFIAHYHMPNLISINDESVKLNNINLFLCFLPMFHHNKLHHSFLFFWHLHHSFEILMMWSKLIQFNNLRNKIEYLFKEKIHVSCIYHSLIFKRKKNMHEQCKIILYCQSITTIIYTNRIYCLNSIFKSILQ
jgi:uncharacterized membrane protein YwaF